DDLGGLNTVMAKAAEPPHRDSIPQPRTRNLERSIGRKPRAIKWGRVHKRQLRRHWHGKFSRGHSVLGVTAIDHETGHHNRRTERFPIACAELAGSTRRIDPRDAGPVTLLEV